MTPDQINQKHGKPSWRCNSCGAESGLTWWNGLSVAVCARNADCHATEGKKFSEAAELQEINDAAYAEWIGQQ